jgi:hypothetical protein
MEVGLPTHTSVHHWMCNRTARPEVCLTLATVPGLSALRLLPPPRSSRRVAQEP